MNIAIFGDAIVSKHYAENTTPSWVQLLSREFKVTDFSDVEDNILSCYEKFLLNYNQFDNVIFVIPKTSDKTLVSWVIDKIKSKTSDNGLHWFNEHIINGYHTEEEFSLESITDMENSHWVLNSKNLSNLTDIRQCGITSENNIILANTLKRLLEKQSANLNLDLFTPPSSSYLDYFVDTNTLEQRVTNNYKTSESTLLCGYPFSEIAMKDYVGDKLVAFWPCCMMGNQTSATKDKNTLQVVKPSKYTPQEMYDHPRMQKLRSNLLQGVQDSACETCWDQEGRGLKSFRTGSNGGPRIEKAGLHVLDVTASNICNLRCRMCAPSASNLLMTDYKYFEDNNLLGTIDRVTDFRFGKSVPYRATDSKQWEWLMNNTHSIDEIKASGGEPLYDNKIIILLKKYIETGAAKKTKLHFHTNATQFTDEVCEILNEFKLNAHTFSADGSGKVYDYVRYPATFEEVNKSINNYINKVTNKSEKVEFNLVVSSLNLLNIDAYLEWVNTLTTLPQVHLSEIYTPSRGIAIKHLPLHLLSLAKERLQPYKDQKYFSLPVTNLIRNIDNAINESVENKELMLEEITLFDKSRNQTYRDFLDTDLIEWLDK